MPNKTQDITTRLLSIITDQLQTCLTFDANFNVTLKNQLHLIQQHHGSRVPGARTWSFFMLSGSGKEGSCSCSPVMEGMPASSSSSNMPCEPKTRALFPGRRVLLNPMLLK